MNVVWRVMLDKSVLGYCVLSLLLLQIFDGFVPQAQMVFFHGHMYVPTAMFRVPILILLLLATIRHGFQIPKHLFFPYVIFFLYLFFDFIYLALLKGYREHPVYGMATFNNYYSFFLFLPFAFSLAGTIKKSCFYTILGMITIPVLILGFLQYFLNESIIPVASVDKHFEAQSVFFYNIHIRAFSFFSSGLFFGTYCALLIGFATAFFVKTRGVFRVPSGMVLAIGFTGVFVTLTRSNIVHGVLVFVSVIILQIGLERPIFQKALQMFHFLVSLGVLFFAPVLHQILALTKKYRNRNPHLDFMSGFTSNESLILRSQHWKELVVQYVKTPADWLLGSGVVQSYHSPFSAIYPIDNSYLATVLHSGLLGLGITLVVLTRIWLYFYHRFLQTRDPFDLGLTAFLSTWPFYGMINNAWFVYGMAALLGVLVRTGSEEAFKFAEPGRSPDFKEQRMGLTVCQGQTS